MSTVWYIIYLPICTLFYGLSLFSEIYVPVLVLFWTFLFWSHFVSCTYDITQPSGHLMFTCSVNEYIIWVFKYMALFLDIKQSKLHFHPLQQGFSNLVLLAFEAVWLLVVGGCLVLHKVFNSMPSLYSVELGASSQLWSVKISLDIVKYPLGTKFTPNWDSAQIWSPLSLTDFTLSVS